MSKKVIMGASAACILTIAASSYYAQQQSTKTPVEEASTSTTTTAADKSALYEEIAAKIKTKAHDEPIVVQIFADGYLEKHGDHYHNKRGDVPKNATISLLQEPIHASTADHYTFNPDDIVEENELGYVVRHGDHYHFIFKNHVAQSNAHTPSTATEEAFVFDKKNIIAETSSGYIVQHGDHTHFVPKDPSPSNLSNNQTTTSHLAKHGETSTPLSEAEQKRQAKIAAYIKQYQLDPQTIRIEGDYLIYPHGDHYHSISLLDDQHSHQHAHENEQIGMETLEKMGIHPELIHSLLHASTHDDRPFPSKETDPNKMREFLAQVASINVGQIEHPFAMTGFEYLTNLETLAAGFTPISNQELEEAFTKYPHLKQVKRLWLTRTGISDYTFTRDMPNLIGLDLSSNNVTNFDFIKALKLTELAAADSNIKSIDFLAGTSIRHLNLDYNGIQDLSPLQSLPLNVLSIEHNDLSSLTSLSGNQTLNRLFIGNSADRVQTIDLKGTVLPNLRELTAKHIGLQQLTDLATLEQLTTLDVSGNALEQLTGVEALTNLTSLTVSHNRLQDLAALSKATSLKEVQANHNQISQLTLPTANTSIEQLQVANNRIQNLDGISSFEKLAYLNIDHNLLESFKAVDPSPSLTYISAKHNRLKSWDGLREHTRLSGGDVQEGNQLPPFPSQATTESTSEQPTSHEHETDETTTDSSVTKVETSEQTHTSNEEHPESRVENQPATIDEHHAAEQDPKTTL